MIGRVVEVVEDPRYLYKERGYLVASHCGFAQGRVPLESVKTHTAKIPHPPRCIRR